MGSGKVPAGRLAGMTVMIHGKYGYGEKQSLTDRAQAQGAEVVEELTAKVTYLVLPELASGVTLQKKVQSLNAKGAAIQVMDAASFTPLVVPAPAEIAALIRDGGHEETLQKLIGRSYQWIRSQTSPQFSVSGEKFDGVTLADVVFSDVEFSGCSFAGTHITNTNMPNAVGCDFTQCRGEGLRLGNISNSTFAGADLKSAEIQGNISGADFTGAQLRDAKIRGHGIHYARSGGASIIADATIFRRAGLGGATFERFNFNGADFGNADLAGSSFADCAFEASSFKSAKMGGSRMVNCKFQGADFSGADLRGANFSRSDLSGATFDGADVADCNFYGAATAGADFSHAKNYDPNTNAVVSAGPALKELDGIFTKAKRIQVTFRIESPGDPEGEEVSVDTTMLKYGWGVRTQSGITNPSSGTWKHNQNMACSDALLQAAGLLGKRKVRFETVDMTTTKSPTSGKELKGLVIKGLEEAFQQTAPPEEELTALTKAYRTKDAEKNAAAKEAREQRRAAAEKAKAKEKKHVEKKIEKAVGGKVKDLSTFLTALELRIEKAKIDKATSMLKKSGFQLYNDVTDAFMSGVVKSQTDPDLVYACRINHDGTYACCTQNLNICGGLRGSICKHLLVLIVGLVKAGELDPTTIDGWIAKSLHEKAELDKEKMGEIFIKYKGAEAGEVDWRPTETLPEDYYAV